jgi:hypothetical protein
LHSVSPVSFVAARQNTAILAKWGNGMIERLTTEVKRYPGQTDRGPAEQARPSIVWYLDPMTGKPVARWVVEKTEATASRWLPSAA